MIIALDESIIAQANEPLQAHGLDSIQGNPETSDDVLDQYPGNETFVLGVLFDSIGPIDWHEDNSPSDIWW